MLFGLSLLLSAVLGSANAVLKRVTFLACFIFRFLRRPQGVPQDYKQAHAWFSVAAANGHSNATKGRDMAAAELTPAGKEEAQALASQYFEQYQPKQ